MKTYFTPRRTPSPVFKAAKWAVVAFVVILVSCVGYQISSIDRPTPQSPPSNWDAVKQRPDSPETAVMREKIERLQKAAKERKP